MIAFSIRVHQAHGHAVGVAPKDARAHRELSIRTDEKNGPDPKRSEVIDKILARLRSKEATA